MINFRTPVLWAIALAPFSTLRGADATSQSAVSYTRDVLPIFRSECQGCHQPAKQKGDYVMTDFASLLAGGESGDPAIIPGHPEESYLIELITPVDGASEMPPKDGPLPEDQVAMITRWVAEGAVDDSPPRTAPKVDAGNPPVYSQLPVVTSLDFSPDGKWLAVAGYHEVLLHKSDGSEIVHRLVGLSERVESVRFSPDGKRLAVAGGDPGRSGELQIWDVEKRSLLLSKAVTYDTIYGASWSPDGTRIAVGCAHDKSVRAFDAKTGAQILFMGGHDDWPLATVWSKEGTHVVSGGRDMTTKLTEVESERFIDNITSITPKALKGGIHSLARQPENDFFLVGGADGEPKIYRAFREVERKIGDDSNLIRRYPSLPGRLFSVAFAPDGKTFVAAASLDGKGTLTVCSSDFDATIPDEIKKIWKKTILQRNDEEKEKYESWWKEGAEELTRLNFETPVFAVAYSHDGNQIAVAGGDGVIRFLDAESFEIVHETNAVPLLQSEAGEVAARAVPDYIRDVNPIVTKLGCNAGTCHGSKDGKNGFKLSLRGYDAFFDIRSLTDDHASRRVNVAAPDASLMLLKATAAVPHEGKQLLETDSEYYQVLRDWIAAGAKVDHEAPRVVSITVSPENPVIQEIGETRQMKVVATYADGETRDVTKDSFIESGNLEVATHNDGGLLTTIRRGEAPVLARYEGAYASTVLTVMGDRSGFVWKKQAENNEIDGFVHDKLQRMRILPSGLCTDEEFVRRIYLDLTGLPPSPKDLLTFLEDERPSRQKRKALIDRLIGNEDFIDHWTNKWADLLQVNRKFLGPEGATKFRGWIRAQVAGNRPYDEFVRDIVTASGSNSENPAASYYKILRNPEDTVENTTHLFLATRFNCNKCHDHPFERWTQDQYYELAASFSQVSLKRAPESGKRNIGGSAVEKAKPLFEVVYDNEEGEMIHGRTNEIAEPAFPYDANYDMPKESSRREQLAAWMTSPDNAYFAKSYVNRIWGYLLGTGIIEPLDDIRAGNPPTNPELLDWLTRQFIDSNFNTQHLIRLICESRAYQRSIKTNKWNVDDKINFSHAKARRLPAEVLYDAVYTVTGAKSQFPGVPAGTRAAALPDVGVELPDGFLGNLGRPVRESACECERSNDLQLGSVMALVSGPTVADAIGDEGNAISRLAETTVDDRELIDNVFLRVLNRKAGEEEIDATLESWSLIDGDHEKLVTRLAKEESAWVFEREKLETKRQVAIGKAKAELREYTPEHERKKREAEAAQKERIAEAKKVLEEVEANIPGKVEAWEQSLAVSDTWTKWRLLKPESVSLADKSETEILPDGSVRPKKTNPRRLDYHLAGSMVEENITGIMIESIPDESFAGFGAGLSGNGNFVVTEVQASWNTQEEPKEKLNLAFADAKADFNQEGFDVKKAINGDVSRADKGWAIAGSDLKARHRAMFRFEEPMAGSAEGATLTVSVLCRYSTDNYPLGRFRIWYTTDSDPLHFGLPNDVAMAAGLPPSTRTDEQKARLRTWVMNNDDDYNHAFFALAKEQRPLPGDKKLAALKAAVTKAERPVPVPDPLLQLRQDVDHSIEQTAFRRRTAAQDLTWALINSPAFLFNH